jgi:uncharacterized protein YecT (DUF1311 family)
MLRICFLALGMLLSITSHATDGIKCNPNGNQLEMNVCASEDFAKADKELNSTYQSLLQKEKNNPLFIRKLRLAQKAWLAFRDADLEAAFACAEPDVRICWGSMYPMSFLIRKTELTQERTMHLKQMLEDPSGK